MSGIVHVLSFAKEGGVEDLQVDCGAGGVEESALGHSRDIGQNAVFQDDGGTVLDVEASSWGGSAWGLVQNKIIECYRLSRVIQEKSTSKAISLSTRNGEVI